MTLKDMQVGTMGWLDQTPYLKTASFTFSNGRLNNVVNLRHGSTYLMQTNTKSSNTSDMRDKIKEEFYERA